MSKTLFWYIFWNLVRVFAMTVLSLSGIMTFAGLLRPLTENGLDLAQTNRLLMYLLPAMTTYSLPVAALFAATVVYGRLSADNELIAMRAGGIAYVSANRFSIALPALILGLLVAVVSLLLLCFIVPILSWKVEQVIYSNIGRLVVSKIERRHEVGLPGIGGGAGVNVYAESARLYPPDPAQPQMQRVQMTAPAITTYETIRPDVRVPREFYLARMALVTIDRGTVSDSDVATLRVQLQDGLKFPREFAGNVQMGVDATSFGPIEIPSLVNENVKFMNVNRLAELAADSSTSQNVQADLREIARREQELTYLKTVATALNDSGIYSFDNDIDTGDGFQIGCRAGRLAQLKGNELVVSDDAGRGVRLQQSHGSQQTLWAQAREIHVGVWPDPIHQILSVNVELYDALPQNLVGQGQRRTLHRSFTIPETAVLKQLAARRLSDYRNDPLVLDNEAEKLAHDEMVANNAVRSELHGRASFAISCLTLVMVGCALGAMFRSGNYLNAFAVSFLPALLCVTLVFCGQQAATHVPWARAGHVNNPLMTGLTFIWIGNFVVLGVGAYLTARLQRR